MDINTARIKLMELQRRLSAFSHAMELLSYDGETAAPKDTASNRAHSIAQLSEEDYIIRTGKDTVELLEFLDSNKEELTEEEKRMVYLLLKDIRQMEKIPMKEYTEYKNLVIKAQDAWGEAKNNNDLSSFEPYFEKIFDAKSRFAKYCGPEKHPYDYWLGEFEEGLDMETCDIFFNGLRERITHLIKEITEKGDAIPTSLQESFPIDKQEELSEYLMDIMGLDRAHTVLSTSEHPFTTSLGSHADERITTHYLENDFISSMFSVIHEGGHALYDTGVSDKYLYSVLDAGISMGVHESQSRFYENLLCRSKEFLSFIYPKLQELFPDSLANVTAHEFYKIVNKSCPSLIRTDADEVTYSLHILIRYELEKKVISGELKVSDLPKEWNRLYKEYLGVDVPDDAHGVLQDVHWSCGDIGYFPSYALGSAYGAHFLAKMKETIDVNKDLSQGDFSKINAWNKENIWIHGSLYPSNVLIEKVLGEKFSPDYYLTYLEEKYKEIYGL